MRPGILGLTRNLALSLTAMDWRRLPVIVAGMLCTMAYLYLATSSTEYGVATLSQMFWVCGAANTILLVVFYLVGRDTLHLTWWDVLVFAVLFRAIGLFAYPVLEDDFFRYLWDGWQTETRGSPYDVAPAVFFAVELPDMWFDVLDGISYPDVATVYGPTAQWLFALSYSIAPGEVWPLQFIAALADIGVILVLRQLAPLRWALLYAWSPLLIKEFAFTAHMDVVGVFFLMAALQLRVQQASEARHVFISVAVGGLLALACGVKIFAVVAVPFLLQSDWRGWLAFCLGLIILALPFGVLSAWLPAGLQAMGSDWLFNAPIYITAAAGWGVSGLAVAKILCAILFVGLAMMIFLKSCGHGLWPKVGRSGLKVPAVKPADYLSAMTFLFGALLFTLPVLNPWYLVWWLALAVLRPSITAWTCAVVLLLSYASGINLGDPNLQLYEQPVWVLALEFGAVVVALGLDVMRARGLTRDFIR